MHNYMWCISDTLLVVMYVLSITYIMFRSNDEQKSDVKKYAKKSSDVNKKKRILTRMTTGICILYT